MRPRRLQAASNSALYVLNRSLSLPDLADKDDWVFDGTAAQDLLPPSVVEGVAADGHAFRDVDYTTLADLFTLLGAAPSSTIRTSPIRQSSDESDDGVAHGWQGWLRWRSIDSFFPLHLSEAAILGEGVSDHCHERMTAKALPGSSLEMIEAKFFFQLLMALLADPGCVGSAPSVGWRDSISSLPRCGGRR